MFRLYLSSLMLTFFLNACEDPPKTKVDRYSLIRIDNTRIDTVSDISSIIDSISVSLIKEPVGNYMGDIFKIEVTRNKDYLFFDLQANKISVFDRHGNFMKTVSKAGDGPYDPLNIIDFWVDNNNELQVYDFAQMKIFNYDSQFNFKNSTLSTQFNHFTGIRPIPTSTNYVGYANFNMYNKPFKDHSYQIALLDKDLNVFKTYQHFDHNFLGILLLTYPQHFTRYKDTLRFYKAYDNHVYNVSNSGISKSYKITYVRQPLPDDIYPTIERHLNEFKDRSKRTLLKLSSYFGGYTRFNGGWFENDKYVYLSSFTHLEDSGNTFYTILEKPSNQILFNAKDFIETKKYKLRLPSFQYMDTFSNELIAVVNGKDLKTMLFKESGFQDSVISNPSHIYLVRVKLK